MLITWETASLVSDLYLDVTTASRREFIFRLLSKSACASMPTVMLISGKESVYQDMPDSTLQSRFCLLFWFLKSVEKRSCGAQ